VTEIIAAYKVTAAKLLQDPDDPEQLSNQFTLLSTTRRGPAQLALAKRCYEVAPNEFIAVFNYASALMRGGMNSLDMFKRASRLAPPDKKAVTLHHIGLAYHDRGEYWAALVWYGLAQHADPDEPKIGQSIAIAKLAMGKLKDGLYEFEVKHHAKPRKPISDSGVPWWSGEDLAGKRVILTHEQGFGDTLQFIRFAPVLRGECASLVFSGPDSLAPLIAEQFDCFDDVISEDGPFDADFVTSCMAAIALMGIEYTGVSGDPYMRAEPLALPPRGKLKVGLSWQGSTGYANDALRSAKLADFCPLFDLPGAAFYSLQVGTGAKDITALGLDGFIADLGSTLTDWRSTARAIAAMDVVVTIDSANGHLAGALGKPVLLLLGRAPCWRWMRGRTTPWYDGHKLFRQEQVDCWPMDDVRDALKRIMQ
jgi:tetratricopeptide (TPR) repeat protein